MDDRPLEDAPTTLRRSRDLAIASFLLLATALWLPWWRLRQATPGVSDEIFAVRAFVPVDGFTTAAPYLTGLLVLVAAIWMFARIAGRSIIYEPELWRRDLIIWFALTVLAAASVALWPIPEFDFWGQRVISGGGVVIEQEWRPALGFWLAVLAAALQLVAWRLVPAVHQPDQGA